MDHKDIAVFSVKIERLAAEGPSQFRVHLTIEGLHSPEDAQHAACWVQDAILHYVEAVGAETVSAETFTATVTRKDVH